MSPCQVLPCMVLCLTDLKLLIPLPLTPECFGGAVEMTCQVKMFSTESDNLSLILGILMVKEKLYSDFPMFIVAHLHEYTHGVGE